MSPIAVPSTAPIPPTTKTSSTPTSTTTHNPQPSSSPYHASSTKTAISLEHTHAAQNYHPLPIVFSRALACTVWDPEGHSYLDFLSAYSAVNQGHCHPALVSALTQQASRLTLSSRAFYNDVFPQFAEFVTRFFGFDRVLPMNTGAEAVETAVKVARAWGVKYGKIKDGEVGVVLGVEGNFHGRTYSAISLSADPSSRDGFGPFVPGVTCKDPRTGGAVKYDDVEALRGAVRAYEGKVVAVVLEPVQGEAGIVVPKKGYLEGVAQVCKEEGCLMVLDEIQTGIARTGKLLCHEWAENVKPDMLLLGKAISGGMYPVSCVLGREEVMLSVDPGSHGSTYGGNPLGCAVAMKALEVVRDEGLVERAETLGKIFRKGLEEMITEGKAIKEVRGMGLLNAIVIDEKKAGGSAWDLCLVMKERGMLAKPTHGDIIRLAPPLVITEEELEKALGIIREALDELASKKNGSDDKEANGKH